MYNISDNDRDLIIKLLSWHTTKARGDDINSANKIRQSNLLIKKLKKKKRWKTE